MSVTKGCGTGLNLFTVCDLSEREKHTCLDHTKSPVLSFPQMERKGQQKQTKQHKGGGLFCFVLTARESGHPLFSKAGGKNALHFRNFFFFLCTVREEKSHSSPQRKV